jgi:probable phosphoglycerate mutase
VLVVWHGTLMRLVLCRLLGIPEGTYREVMPEVRNTALTELRLEADGGSAGLLSFNAPAI